MNDAENKGDSGAGTLTSSRAIAIRLNGEERTLHAGATVSSLLAQLELDGDGVAVEVNREIVHRSKWDSAEIPDAASIEVVQFVGGG